MPDSIPMLTTDTVPFHSITKWWTTDGTSGDLNEALESLAASAQGRGANAVVGLRITPVINVSSKSTGPAHDEVSTDMWYFVYGTPVAIVKD